MNMLIACTTAALLVSATACDLSERLTGTKPQANAPACTTPPFLLVPDSSFTETVNGMPVVHTRFKLLCGEDAKQWQRAHPSNPSNRSPG